MWMNKLDSLTNEEILKLKIKDLNLDIPSKYRGAIKVLNSLLKSKGINWMPHYWLSNEWFSADGIPGIAIPFTLCHPKLIKLEKQFLGHCEGESPQEFFKILCHETGHAIDNAFKLRLKKRRQKLFGLTSKKYPKSYKPNPLIADQFVTHFEDFYAQAHPDEDWAETFAIWLSTNNWRSKYKNSTALNKLIYIDQLMSELRDKDHIKNQKTYEHYKEDGRTVYQFLIDKKKQLGKNKSNYYRNKVQDLFLSSDSKISANSYLLKMKNNIINNLLEETNYDFWTVNKCFNELEDECKNKKYVLKYDINTTEHKIQKLLIGNIDQFIRSGKTRIYL